MVNALVVYCHPCDDSFVAAVKGRVLAALERGSGSVDVIDLYAEGFDPRLTEQEHADHRAGPETKPHVAAHAELLGRCDTIVLVYPTWWGGQPAMLKGWLERVWVNGVAYDLTADRGPRPRLTNVRRIVAVTTHGSSKWINAVEGEGGKRTVTRAMRASCGWRCRTTWLALYGIDTSTPAQRERFLARVERRISRLR